MATTSTLATFATLLKGYRLWAGLTQEGLAERAGLSARALSAERAIAEALTGDD